MKVYTSNGWVFDLPDAVASGLVNSRDGDFSFEPPSREDSAESASAKKASPKTKKSTAKNTG